MAKTVASLSVSINARTKGLQRGLRSAKGHVSDFASQVGALSKKIAAIGAGVAAVGGGAIAVGTKKAINSLSDLAKTSDKLSGIDPTALIALRDAAQESGVEVKTFDMGLQRMLRRIQEASQGKGEAQGVLKDLRLDAKALVKLAPEKQFALIAKAMVKAKDDGLDLSRAMKLFDSEGVALINTLRLIDKQGLDHFIEQVRQSGRAVTRDMLRPSEAVEDSMKRLGDRVTGVFTQIGVAASKPLSEMLANIEAFLNKPEQTKAMNEAFKDLADSIERAAKGVGSLIENRDKLMNEAKAKKDGALGFGARIVKGIGTVAAGAMAATSENFRRAREEGAKPHNLGGFLRELFNPQGGKAIMDQALSDAAEIMRPTNDAIFEAGLAIERSLDAAATSVANGVRSAAESARQSVDTAISGAATTSTSGKVFRLERGDGTPIPFGGKSGPELDELKKQTKILEGIKLGADPASLPKGTMIIVRG